MKRCFTVAGTILALAGPAEAALPVGSMVPDFTVGAAQGGETITVSLAELRKKGPVVVFFFPSAFTDGPACRDFAALSDAFAAAGASVVGMSRDTIDTMVQFSVQDCAAKFPLARAELSLVDALDVNDGATFNTRTTYVIDPSGAVVFVDDNPEAAGHAQRALAFVQAMDHGNGPLESGVGRAL